MGCLCFIFFCSVVEGCSMRQFVSSSLVHIQAYLFIKRVTVVVTKIPIIRIFNLTRSQQTMAQGKSYDSELRMVFTYFNG